MQDSTHVPHTALKFQAEVQRDGRLELTVPFLPGARVVVFVIEEATDVAGDLVSAAESTLAFWDNPYDDEDWNDAGVPKARDLVSLEFPR